MCGSTGVVHGKPAGYNEVLEECDDELGAEKGIGQEEDEDRSGKEMHGSGVKKTHVPPFEKQGLRKILAYQVWENRIQSWKRQVKRHCQPNQRVKLAILLPNRLRLRQQRNPRRAVGVGQRTSDELLRVENMYSTC